MRPIIYPFYIFFCLLGSPTSEVVTTVSSVSGPNIAFPSFFPIGGIQIPADFSKFFGGTPGSSAFVRQVVVSSSGTLGGPVPSPFDSSRVQAPTPGPDYITGNGQES